MTFLHIFNNNALLTESTEVLWFITAHLSLNKTALVVRESLLISKFSIIIDYITPHRKPVILQTHLCPHTSWKRKLKPPRVICTLGWGHTFVKQS